jgi:hypothetical protein
MKLLEEAHRSRRSGRGRRIGAKLTAEAEFRQQVQLAGLPDPELEHKFAERAGRRWRFDVAWPTFMLAVEIEGLVVREIGGEWVVQGRHATVTGFREDCVKYARAVILGWGVLRFEQNQVRSGAALALTVEALEARGYRHGS